MDKGTSPSASNVPPTYNNKDLPFKTFDNASRAQAPESKQTSRSGGPKQNTLIPKVDLSKVIDISNVIKHINIDVITENATKGKMRRIKKLRYNHNGEQIE